MRARHLTAPSVAFATVLLVGASGVHAAFTAENCLAKKRGAQGKLQQCRATEEAKALQGKPADVAKCTTKFQDKVAKLNETASDKGIGCRFRDNGNGTVTDYDTGLQWEQKVSPGAGLTDPHDVDNLYTWSSGTAANGTAFTDFLSRLNNCNFPSGIGFFSLGFAGHCDWRLPSLSELQTILAPAPCGDPCIDPIFGPTGAMELYFTATTQTEAQIGVWAVIFGGLLPGPVITSKQAGEHARAVRGGL